MSESPFNIEIIQKDTEPRGPIIGDLYMNQDNILMIYNGEEWISATEPYHSPPPPSECNEDPTVPSLSFGDGDLYMGETADSTLSFAISGVENWRFTDRKTTIFIQEDSPSIKLKNRITDIVSELDDDSDPSESS